MSKSYMVIRKRAYWVREVMHVDASTPEEAEDTFLNEFNPELVIEEPYSSGTKQIYEPTEVIENE